MINFKTEMKEHPEYDQQSVGSRILLTGTIVRDRINACVRCGVDLVREVNAWAIAHPE